MICTPSSIRERLQVRPFTPFRIVTSAGHAYDVMHPDMVWIGETDIHVGISSKKDPSLYAQVSRIYFMHISSFDDLPVSPPVASNGQHS